MKYVLSLSLLLLLTPTLFAQGTTRPPVKVDQNAPKVWDFQPLDKYSASTVRIIYNGFKGNGGEHFKGHGSGVIIRSHQHRTHETFKSMCIGYIITCYHVVDDSTTTAIKIEYQNGASAPGVVVARFPDHDLALVKTWVPKDLLVIKIATTQPKYGDTVYGAGYGHKWGNIRDLRYFKTKVWRSTAEVLILTEDVVPGDSGGPIFNEKHELIGLISKGAAVIMNGERRDYVSPAECPSILPIRVLLYKEFITKACPIIEAPKK